jgi:hypothetical protein
MARFILTSFIGLSVLAGCVSESSERRSHPLSSAEKKEFRESWGGSAEDSPVSHPKSVQVASGPAPLAYIVDQSGSITIEDDRGRHWGPTPVQIQSIVKISADTGIAIDGIELDRGPLLPERTYIVQLSLPEEMKWKNATQGGPTTAPSQPMR